MSIVRIGVIGLGNMGSSHARRLLDHEVHNAALTAVCNLDPKPFAAFPGIPSFTDSRKLIRSKLVDAVVIATPHFAHTPIGIDALRRGLHVLVEKPISVHKRDAEKLIAAHANPKQVFGVMFNQRADPRYRKVREMLMRGELGRLQRVCWIITDWFRTDAYYRANKWRATWKGEGGGVLMNQCPHQLDLLCWLLGMPARVRAACHLGKYHKIEVEDEVTAYLEYENGMTGVFIASTGEAPGINALEIAGDLGRVMVEDNRVYGRRNEQSAAEFGRTTKEYFATPRSEPFDLTFEGSGGQHREILQNFVDAILHGTPLIAPAVEGLLSVELANAMLLSSVTNRTVSLPLDSSRMARLVNKLIRESSCSS